MLVTIFQAFNTNSLIVHGVTSFLFKKETLRQAYVIFKHVQSIYNPQPNLTLRCLKSKKLYI